MWAIICFGSGITFADDRKIKKCMHYRFYNYTASHHKEAHRDLVNDRGTGRRLHEADDHRDDIECNSAKDVVFVSYVGQLPDDRDSILRRGHLHLHLHDIFRACKVQRTNQKDTPNVCNVAPISDDIRSVLDLSDMLLMHQMRFDCL